MDGHRARRTSWPRYCSEDGHAYSTIRFLETIRGVEPDKDIVEDAMSTDIFSVPPSAPLRRVVARMAEKRLGSAVVVDRDKVVGLFTTTDALNVLSRLLT
jgi:acetoin utilization protein AcuB